MNASAHAAKLNLKPGMKLRIVGKPAGVSLPGVTGRASANAEAVIVFAKALAEVDSRAGPALDAAREDRIAWVAYPKAGKLDTDLNRDVLWRHLLGKGIQGVRQVALDEVWSAMRFRPKK
jgi:hypothetical protein